MLYLMGELPRQMECTVKMEEEEEEEDAVLDAA